MNIDRIKEIQQQTAYPESVSVQQALLKVWNECEQELNPRDCCTCKYVYKKSSEDPCYNCSIHHNNYERAEDLD